MPQFLSDFWNALDWPNIVVGGVFALALTYLAARLATMWAVSWETSRIILSKRKKSAIKRDLRIVRHMHSDPNFATLWCTARIVEILLLTLAALLIFITFSLSMIFVRVDANASNALIIAKITASIFPVPMWIIMFELTSFLRIYNYYTKFDEFLRRAHEALTIEELREIEGTGEETASQKTR